MTKRKAVVTHNERQGEHTKRKAVLAHTRKGSDDKEKGSGNTQGKAAITHKEVQ